MMLPKTKPSAPMGRGATMGVAPVASTTVRASTSVPSANRIRYCPSSRVSCCAVTGTLVRAPNFLAWIAARSASSPPDIPAGNPR